MNTVKKTAGLVPGFVLSLLIAAVAKFLESLLPIHLIGASVIALFIGMSINACWKPTAFFASGLKFTSKKMLKFAIILLGASLNIGIVLRVGKMSLVGIAPMIHGFIISTLVVIVAISVEFFMGLV